MISFPLLSAIIFWPLLGGMMILAFRRYPDQCRWLGLTVALGDLGLVLLLAAMKLTPDPATGWLLAENFAWIEGLGIRYSLGVDAISLVLLLLTSMLGVLAVLISWRQITRQVAAFHFLLLFVQSAVLGVFLAIDLFLFYLFWELQVVPMLFIIAIWGHGQRLRAALKFFLFSVAGSLPMLAAVIGLYLTHGSQTGQYSFAMAELSRTTLSPPLAGWLYTAFLLAFAIKIPAVPVHTWLPDAHTEAPTAGSVLLAGLLLKTGAYGLLRIANPLFPGPAGQSAGLLAAAGLIGVFYAGAIALAQTDMKRLIAYSSIGHMGLILVGVAIGSAMTMTGAVLQMVNHGLTTSALFILAGMLDERFGTRALADFSGLWKTMPGFSAFFLFFGMAALGLPGLNNFIGEVLIIIGAFRKNPALGALAAAGIVVTLIYVLRLLQETIYGPLRTMRPAPDLTWREVLTLAPLALAVLAIGLHPGPLLDLLEAPMVRLVLRAG